MASIYRRKRIYWIEFLNPLSRKRVQKSLKTDNKKLALTIKKDIEVRLARGEYTGSYERTLRNFLDEYDRYIEIHLRPLSVKRYRENCAVFFRFLESLAITDIKLEKVSPRLIEDYKVWRLDRGSMPVTVNHAIVHLKSILNLAIKWGYLSKNPIREVGLIPVEKHEVVFLSTTELHALIEGVHKPTRAMVSILAYTGLRRDELAHLHWQDIDLEKRLLHVRNREGARTKTRRERTIPLPEKAVMIFKQLHQDGKYVFQRLQQTRFRRNGLRENIVAASERAGIKKHITTHTLRHTYASHLAMHGVSILIIARLLGVTVDTAQIYAHLLPHKLHDVVELLPY